MYGRCEHDSARVDGTILLVDDEPDFLEIVGGFLEDEGFSILRAHDAREALEIFENTSIDLVLSDINMPGMKGYELLHEIGKKYPTVKRILITAYDIRDYLKMAQKYGIGNIFPKSTPFNFSELRFLLNSILSGKIFGLDRYLSASIESAGIRTADDIEKVIHCATESLQSPEHRRKFRQVLGEIVINAFFYGARNERGDRKGTWHRNVTLSPDEEIQVFWGADSEKSGVAVRDQKGRLRRTEVLHRLERNVRKSPNDIPPGINDTHGKGLYIAHEAVDRLIINVHRHKMTEVIMLEYNEREAAGSRPLWIYEL